MALEGTNAVKIYQGETIDLNIRLAQDDQTNSPFDMTAVTSVEVLLPNADGTALVKSVVLGSTPSNNGITLVNQGAGIFTVNLTVSDTQGLLAGELLSIEVRVFISSIKKIIPLPQAITVIPSLFPDVA